MAGDKKNYIRNTAAEPQPVPAPMMMPGAIEASERRGQDELVRSSVLPTEGLDDLIAAWGSLGFKVGDRVPNDELFTFVELPAGWTMKATDHAMWSRVLDDNGRERAAVFYKAAFYDRRAFVRVLEQTRD